MGLHIKIPYYPKEQIVPWTIFFQDKFNFVWDRYILSRKKVILILSYCRCLDWIEKRTRFNPLRQVRTRIKRKWIYESILTFSHHSLFKTSRDERSTFGERSKSSQTRRTEHSRLARGFAHRQLRVAWICVKLQKKVSIQSEAVKLLCF